MQSGLVVTVVVAVTAGVAGAFDASDEVISLPGWTGPLPSKHYSGYLPVGKTSGKTGFIHYWLILSENDPDNDPLVYWSELHASTHATSTSSLLICSC